MTKKIFGMAAISALAFGMFACSGEDGADGVNGKDGADGISCSVKALKDKSGFKVLCDGDSVGVLKNGTDGKAGKDGAAGKDGKDGEDGEDASATDGKAGKDGSAGKDGTSCTAKAVKDGFAIICGTDTVGTVKNGDAGEDGDGCSLTEGDNGVITVTCGDKSVNIFKAMCDDETTPYDPETQLCSDTYDPELDAYVTVAVPRCKNWFVLGYGEDDDHSDNPYDPNYYFCDDDMLVPKCYLRDKDNNDSAVTYKYETSYCDTENNKISAKVPCGTDADGKKFMKKPDEYCFRYAGDPKTKMRTAPMETCGTGNAMKTYSPVEKFCKRSNGLLGDMNICAENPDKADQYNIDIRYMGAEIYETHEGQMCDNRDWNIYRTMTFEQNGTTWMIQNLRYVIPESKGKGMTVDLDSGSFCFNNDCTRYRGERAYLWSAAIDSASLANAETPTLCGNGEAACTFDKPVQGVCPDGWHLPMTSDFIADTDFKSKYASYTALAYQANYASTDPLKRKEMTFSSGYWYIWTALDQSTEAVGIVDVEYMRKTTTQKKYYALPVRCVKDAPEEVAP